MKFLRLYAVSALLLVFTATGEAGAGQGRSGWYIGGGIGANWTSQVEQAGWNRDAFCYPDFSCAGRDVQGYRWNYDLDMDAGSAFEIAVGRIFNRWRLEISAAQRNNDIEQRFTGLTYLDGSPVVPAQSPQGQSNGTARIDDLTTRMLSLNAYYDFTDAFGRMTPYLGVGLGVAFVEIAGLHFSSDYKDPSDPSRDLSSYNSKQDADMSDTVFVGNLYAGMDYSLTGNTLLGVKLTYSLMDDFEYTGTYSMHPMHQQDPAFPNHTAFSGPRQVSVTFTAKYLFGD